MDQVRNFLNSLPDAIEASELHLCEVWIGSQQVRVEVRDHGATTGSIRYSATAYSIDVPEAEREMNTNGLSLGNPDSTIETALSNVHWWIFKPTE